jgi:hypothetical protein
MLLWQARSERQPLQATLVAPAAYDWLTKLLAAVEPVTIVEPIRGMEIDQVQPARSG